MRRRVVGRRLGPHWLRLLRGRLVWLLVMIVAVPALIDLVIFAIHPVRDGNQICRTLQVVDGDTVTLWCAGQGTARARLTGFDAPELFSPQCFTEVVAAQRAKWALRLMLIGAADLQMTRQGEDRFGRSLVAFSDTDGPLADQIIAGGHARAYDGGRRDGWCARE